MHSAAKIAALFLYDENTWYYSNELTAPDNGTGNNYHRNKSMIINFTL
jgi:hypothetical protein